MVKDICPVCGKPRGKYIISHGHCMEVRAKTDGVKMHIKGDGTKDVITEDAYKRKRDKEAKKKYLSGRYDKYFMIYGCFD